MSEAITKMFEEIFETTNADFNNAEIVFKNMKNEIKEFIQKNKMNSEKYKISFFGIRYIINYDHSIYIENDLSEHYISKVKKETHTSIKLDRKERKEINKLIDFLEKLKDVM